MTKRPQKLRDYVAVRLERSNDCAWLSAFLRSDANFADEVDPLYLVKVHYEDPTKESSLVIGSSTTLESSVHQLEQGLENTRPLVVVLCHRDSSRVDPRIIEQLWAKFQLETSFLRHHFDYKEVRREKNCARDVRKLLEPEDGMTEETWKFGGRWNPVRLPSETRDSVLRLTVGTECVSICHKDQTAVILVRSKAIYRVPDERLLRRDLIEHTLNTDLFLAAMNRYQTSDKSSDATTVSVYGDVYFYLRLMILRCYEEYTRYHDSQPIDVSKSDRVATTGHLQIEAMQVRRHELNRIKQDLSGYLGPSDSTQIPRAVQNNADSVSNHTESSWRTKIRTLIVDVDMLLSLYDSNMRIYEWLIANSSEEYRAELAQEQLEEARESKATAISLGKLSNIAFLYLPLNFVCTLLGMNLSILGQGQVPVWVFLFLVFFFGLLTYLPVLVHIDSRRRQLNELAFRLVWRSIPAGFWFLAFSLTHNYAQNFEIMNAGLAQVLLGSTGRRTKGWIDGTNDSFFQEALLGSQAFWKGKVKQIFRAVKELDANNEGIELTV